MSVAMESVQYLAHNIGNLSIRNDSTIRKIASTGDPVRQAMNKGGSISFFAHLTNRHSSMRSSLNAFQNAMSILQTQAEGLRQAENMYGRMLELAHMATDPMRSQQERDLLNQEFSSLLNDSNLINDSTLNGSKIFDSSAAQQTNYDNLQVLQDYDLELSAQPNDIASSGVPMSVHDIHGVTLIGFGDNWPNGPFGEILVNNFGGAFGTKSGSFEVRDGIYDTDPGPEHIITTGSITTNWNWASGNNVAYRAPDGQVYQATNFSFAMANGNIILTPAFDPNPAPADDIAVGGSGGQQVDMRAVGLAKLSGMSIATTAEAYQAMDYLTNEISGVGEQFGKLASNSSRINFAMDATQRQISQQDQLLSSKAEEDMIGNLLELSKTNMLRSQNASLMTQATSISYDVANMLL
jgi:flagellin